MARGRQDSPVVWRHRPKAYCRMARRAWDMHVAQDPYAVIVALQYVENEWRATHADGSANFIEGRVVRGCGHVEVAPTQPMQEDVMWL